MLKKTSEDEKRKLRSMLISTKTELSQVKRKYEELLSIIQIKEKDLEL